MKIAIAGAGYVGFSLGVMLSQYHEVVMYDINWERVKLINEKRSPIIDKDIQIYLREKKLNIRATTNPIDAFSNAKYVIVATSADFEPVLGRFDTSSIEDVVSKVLSINPEALIVIKSTIPIGYTTQLREKFNVDNIIFSPEFIREGSALYDNLYPSRIIVGEKSKRALEFAELIRDATEKKNVPIFLTNSEEAEAIKLFANAYLAMRVAFFNELDTFAFENGLDAQEIIKGVCLDPRIGDQYNNPSFGYGGYCLPKDTKQLQVHFINSKVPNPLISAVIESNEKRKEYIAKKILEKNPKVVGIHRLTSKLNGDNFRKSAMMDIVKVLLAHGIKVIAYEPLIDIDKQRKIFIEGVEFVQNLGEFKKRSEIIIANRISEELHDVLDKVFSRDIFHRD